MFPFQILKRLIQRRSSKWSDLVLHQEVWLSWVKAVLEHKLVNSSTVDCFHRLTLCHVECSAWILALLWQAHWFATEPCYKCKVLYIWGFQAHLDHCPPSNLLMCDLPLIKMTWPFLVDRSEKQKWHPGNSAEESGPKIDSALPEKICLSDWQAKKYFKALLFAINTEKPPLNCKLLEGSSERIVVGKCLTQCCHFPVPTVGRLASCSQDSTTFWDLRYLLTQSTYRHQQLRDLPFLRVVMLYDAWVTACLGRSECEKAPMGIKRKSLQLAYLVLGKWWCRPLEWHPDRRCQSHPFTPPTLAPRAFWSRKVKVSFYWWQPSSPRLKFQSSPWFLFLWFNFLLVRQNWIPNTIPRSPKVQSPKCFVSNLHKRSNFLFPCSNFCQSREQWWNFWR